MSHYAEKKDLFPMQGGCACGHIRYQLEMPPLLVHCCHCTMCQRQIGSAFATNAIVESSAVTLLPSSSPTAAGSKENPQPVPCGIMPVFDRFTTGTTDPSTPGSKPVLVSLPSESGVGISLAQCPACHTGLWRHYADVGKYLSYVLCGTLDRPWEVEPDAHIYVRSRRSFVDLADGKPQFEGYYPDVDVMYRPDTKNRVAELHAKQMEWRAALRAAMSEAV